MLIRCFGLDKTFDYRQIGGTDSYFRRLGSELCRRGHRVEFIHYGCREDETMTPENNFCVKHRRLFSDALDDLAGGDGPVLVNAVRAADRLRFIAFRRSMRRKIDFYIVYSLFAQTRMGRLKHFLEAMIYPYRPAAICMSWRLADYMKNIRNRGELLLPPVPPAYFAAPQEKNRGEKLVVSYVGRLDNPKGAPEAIKLLESLSRRDDLELRISGYSFDSTPEAKALSERIERNGRIIFQKRAHQGWSPETETQLISELRETDVLLLPYRRVSSSIDSPLLLLEGMAALCCCVTPPQGDIPRIYGESPFLIPADNIVARGRDLFNNGLRELVGRERMRIHDRIRSLQVDTSSTVDRLLKILGKG